MFQGNLQVLSQTGMSLFYPEVMMSSVRDLTSDKGSRMALERLDLRK